MIMKNSTYLYIDLWKFPLDHRLLEICTDHSSQDGIGHIPGVRADGEGGRVAEHDGRMRSVKDVAHDLVRHVRKVNEHAQAVHLRDSQLLRIIHIMDNTII